MKEFNVALSGEAGQGLQTAGNLIAKSLFKAGYYIFTDKSYHSRIRGGEYIYRIRIADEPINCIKEEPDLIVSLKSDTTNTMKSVVNDSTVVLADEKSKEGLEIEAQYFPFSKLAEEAGNKKTLNVVIGGMILNLLSVPKEIPEKVLNKAFGEKESILKANIEALKSGYELNHELKEPKIDKNRKEDTIMLSGTDGTGLGAISAGCKFLSAYPMTPGTGVMLYLANRADKYSIVVEQAEDEIAAINMAIGASYTGTRAMATTSGGGFALMQEGFSLAGMTETPVVIVDAQRPAPATGMPTRTGQEDLFLTIKAGHGEFSRNIVAPRTPKEAFEYMRKAFYLSDKYQIPSIVLLSQQLTDSYFVCQKPEIEDEYNKRFIVDADENYKRFELTENGISPRAIPGGKGLVRVDSDEHDEYGFITENIDIRKKMVEKRNIKIKELKEEIDEPITFNLEAKNIVIGWGDSWGVIDEVARKNHLGYIHYSELFPLKTEVFETLKNKDFIVIEGNYSGLFAEYLSSDVRLPFIKIGKYDGRPITPTWLEKQLKGVDVL
ncbi:MAG: 2-oxoacid:acceptor oxidoreductase subunit alpha [Kosmotoga sp.]|nr:MAG: 2-oxoacid:acceptor oxidoreductase subunit alpha [Kosmotoga sp.]